MSNIGHLFWGGILSRIKLFVFYQYKMSKTKHLYRSLVLGFLSDVSFWKEYQSIQGIDAPYLKIPEPQYENTRLRFMLIYNAKGTFRVVWHQHNCAGPGHKGPDKQICFIVHSIMHKNRRFLAQENAMHFLCWKLCFHASWKSRIFMILLGAYNWQI